MSLPSSTTLLDVAVQPGRPPILLAEGGDDPARWAGQHRDALYATLREHGALLVRGLGLGDAAVTAAVFRALSGGLMAERESFAPRERYEPGVYSSSKWPQNQPMCMHHELSYTTTFPGLMLFACHTAPQDGGATAVADAAAVLRALPRRLVKRFERQGWLLTRSYNNEIGASTLEAFGTEDRHTIENYCHTNAITYQWQPDGTLHTRQRRSALLTHPHTKQRCWFNQIAFLNQWTLAPEIREYLTETYGTDGLPFNTAYGNGEPIEEDVIDLLNTTYTTHTAREPWQSGDLLLVDNIRTAHSREPFTGTREVLVGLANPTPLADCSPTIEVTTP
ncbi:TauD/TfdA family dioxygenase [Streptomyces sp. WZ-12]|uniref:TauD/TfdA family dioxygenase n=1 Tax=Streptomyces sp. WZ-12 TaxID=3030210 RepID=UPI0023817889|nr:TauD/TfdA family dioxygenase [Streptomyces sp. WZ-12]